MSQPGRNRQSATQQPAQHWNSREAWENEFLGEISYQQFRTVMQAHWLALQEMDRARLSVECMKTLSALSMLCFRT